MTFEEQKIASEKCKNGTSETRDMLLNISDVDNESFHIEDDMSQERISINNIISFIDDRTSIINLLKNFS